MDKVPATGEEALTSSLVGFFQKRKLRSCLMHIAQHDMEKPSTWDGALPPAVLCPRCVSPSHPTPLPPPPPTRTLLRDTLDTTSLACLAVLLQWAGIDLRTVSARAFFDKFGLDASTIDFVGHAMALQPDESYLDRPALETVEAIKLYAGSLERYGKSPFIYPVYGLGGLPESFSRYVGALVAPCACTSSPPLLLPLVVSARQSCRKTPGLRLAEGAYVCVHVRRVPMLGFSCSSRVRMLCCSCRALGCVPSTVAPSSSTPPTPRWCTRMARPSVC